VSVGLRLAHDLYSMLHLAGFFRGFFGQEFQSLFGAGVLCSFCSSSLMLHRCQSRCCAPALGSCGGCRRSVLLKLHLALLLFAVSQACRSVESLIY
jgi:hypothetical protein